MFVIDANNLLGDMGRDRSPTHIHFLLNYLIKLGGKREMLVVFDGNPPCNTSFFPKSRNITIYWQDPDIYRDADEYIVELLGKKEKNSDVTLVTSDKELRFLSRNKGVTNFMTPKQFRKMLEKKRFHKNQYPDQLSDEKNSIIANIDHEALAEELLKEFQKQSK